MIIIGSRALLFRLPQTEEVVERLRKADYDVIMSFEDFVNWSNQNKKYIISSHPRNENKYKVVVVKDGVRKVYEIELGFEGTSSQYLLDNLNIVTDTTVDGFFGEKYYALNLKFQMATKRSHLIYPVHFEKNIKDYHLIKDMLVNNEKYLTTLNNSLKTVGIYYQYYQLRSQEAKDRYNQKTPNLNVSTEDFFSSKLNVPHYFVHDHIHEVMAHHDRPIYTMIQRDASKAWCEKDMFFDLPYDYQVQCVQEEAYVIALERYIIPQFGDDWDDYLLSYSKAVKRICTTLTSGWFRDFAIENYTEVMNRYNPNFVKIFKDAVESGDVDPIQGKTLEDVPPLTA